MKATVIYVMLTLLGMNVFAQKQTFDIVSFTASQGWQQQQNEGGIQLSISDKKTGTYAIAVITKAFASDKTANENFNSSWLQLVKGTVQVNDEPTMSDMDIEKGWDCITGQANYTDGANKGLVTLVCATGYVQTTSVVLMTNTSKYQEELLGFMNSLEISKPSQTQADNSISANTSNSSIVGLWTDYILETTGYYINGTPQYTAGYLRKEYAFYPDGTYLFRNKEWLTKTKDILFIYESGTYTVNGNQLTITPKNGKSGFWQKTTSSKEWGKLVKASDYNLEKITYSFTINNDPTYGKKIVLKAAKPTERDGGKFNAPNDPYEFRYSFRDLESNIDNPPGLKTSFENKSFTTVVTAQTSSAVTVNGASNASIAGLWCYYNTESNGSYNGFPTLTGGYFRKEYIFYADGSYLYRQKNWAVTVKEIRFVYETGTWKINGNKLTVTPKQGEGGWWSKAKSGRTDEWGSLVKKGVWKLEPITYTFDLHYYSGINETHLLLQSGAQTEREGKQDNNTATYSPRALDKSLIDNPPGLKTSFENKSFTTAGTAQTSSAVATTTVNSPIVGKIWEGTSSEKFTGAGTMTGHYTGGFSTMQYTFIADGTYYFVDVLASFYTDTKTLKYESGTWSVNGNQLTINPAQGQNEEWSKVGKTSNGNSDVTNRAINETWGKKLKTGSRKLEKYTYTFSIGKNGDKTALILQRDGRTEREGDGSVSYLNETAVDKSVKLPN